MILLGRLSIALRFGLVPHFRVEFLPRRDADVLVVAQAHLAPYLTMRAELCVDVGVVGGVLRSIAAGLSARYVASAGSFMLAVIELLPDLVRHISKWHELVGLAH